MAGLFGGVSAVSVALTLLWLWPREEKVPQVAFDEFRADLAAGRVVQIGIEKRAYTYRVGTREGVSVSKRALGPEPDIAAVRALRPADPNGIPPLVYFEP